MLHSSVRLLDLLMAMLRAQQITVAGAKRIWASTRPARLKPRT